MAEIPGETIATSQPFQTVLPNHYPTEGQLGVEAYLQDVSQMLGQYQSFIDFQLTRIFVNNILNKIPVEWISAFSDLKVEELNQIPYGFHKTTWPSSLKMLITKSVQLSLSRDQQSVSSIQLSNAQKKGMNSKKVHEVSSVAALIHSICEENQCTHIVDVGSGLGYLSLVLCQNYGYQVIGLENNDSRSHGAEKRAVKSDVYMDSFRSMTFQLEDSSQCFSEFDEVLTQNLGCCKRQETVGHKKQNNTQIPKTETSIQEYSNTTDSNTPQISDTGGDLTGCDPPCQCLNSPTNTNGVHGCVPSSDTDSLRHTEDKGAETNLRVCMLGLHCCGDLTPTMLRLLHSSPNISCLVCISCCYHRMTARQNASGVNNFPMSLRLREFLAGTDQSWTMSQYALRLAAQETRTRWSCQTSEDHEYHTRNVAYRGLLEVALTECGLQLARESRKLANKKDMDNIETYMESVITRAKLKDSDAAKLCLVVSRLHSEYSASFKLIEPLTCIQVLLQPVLETLLTVDRLWYLMENNITATTSCVFSENISPRNIAIIAAKLK